MNFDYGEVLTRAWQITWKYKVLWIFGILAGCARGGGGGGGGSGYSYNSPSQNGNFPETQRLFESFSQWIGDHLWVVALFVAAVILLAVISILLGTIGRIGLIKGTLDVERGAERLAFGELFQASLPYFWRIFLLSFLIGLAFLVIILPLVLFGALTAGVGFLCVLPLICLLIPISLAVTIILEQANVAIVSENLGMLAGLRRAWEIVRANLGPVALMAIILFIIGGVLGIIIALPILVVVFPAAIAFALSNTSNGSNISFTPLIIAGLCIAAYIPVLLLANGILTTYTGSAWTLTYLRLTKPKEETPVVLPPNA
jgi:hypothetical protein